jgi:hypothetical protein
VRGADRGVRGVELAALVAGTELADHAGDAVKRAVAATGTEAADAYVMAARFFVVKALAEQGDFETARAAAAALTRDSEQYARDDELRQMMDEWPAD